MNDFEAQLSLIKVSEASDGDILVIKSDEINQVAITLIKEHVRRMSGKRLIVIGISEDSDIFWAK